MTLTPLRCGVDDVKHLTLRTLVPLLLAIAAICAIPNPPAARAVDYDCRFRHPGGSPGTLAPGDPYGLHADNDGIACEDPPSGGGGGGGGGPVRTQAAPPPPKLNKAAAGPRRCESPASSPAIAPASRPQLHRRLRGWRTKVTCRFLGESETSTSETVWASMSPSVEEVRRRH